MQIHRLMLCNIGPFTGETTIDFTRLSEAGLFLLEGPTGSGKSTILDAIVFALYGQVAGLSSGNDRMRSEHADAGDESFVELVFETSGGVYSIHRVPAYERLKKAGAGTTKQHPKVLLKRLSSPDATQGEPLSSRHQEADSEVSRILGLTRQQFVQTVLLPQGEFAAFLRATAIERQDLLQRLFGTELFKSMEDELDRRSKAAQTQRQAATRTLEDAVTSFLSAAACTDEEREAASAADSDSLATILDAIVETRRQVLLAAQLQRNAAQARLAEVRQSLLAAQNDNKKRERKLRHMREVDELLTRADDHKAARLDRDRLGEARLLAPAYQELIRARSGFEDAWLAATTLEIELTTDFGSDALLDPTATAQGFEQTAAALAGLGVVEANLTQQGQELNAKRTKRDELQARIEAMEAMAHELPKNVARWTKRVVDLSSRAANHATASALVASSSQELDAARRAAETASSIHSADIEVTALHLAASVANDELSALEQSRLDGIAGELASKLVDGQHCPVCGGTDHPEPAALDVSQPTGEMIKAAKVAAETARQNLETATQSRDALKLTHAAARAESRDLGIPQAEVNLTKAEESLGIAEQAITDLPAAEEDLAEAIKESDSHHTNLVTANAQLAALIEQCDALEAAFVSAQSRVAEELSGFSTIKARIEHHQISGKRFSALADAYAQRDGSDAELNRRASQWAQDLAASNVADEETFLQLNERLGEFDALDTAVNEYERDLHTARTALADPELAEVDESSDAIDEGPLAAAVNVQQGLTDDLVAQVGQLQSQVATAEQHRDIVVAEIAAVSVVLDSTASVIRLAGVASANSPANLRRVPLPTYVLITRFKQVLAAANARLQGMSDGRYTIEYHEERESHGRKSGLGIKILDRLTDKQRSPGDLSGGETFYTALSLALGLADVVVAESGGVDLGTLFIDEGFGSLDPDTLDSVLTEISHLRRGGRVVGIVSHVDELKQRISERIEIRRLDSGHSAITVVA